jgi:hypothetical protein
VSIPRGCVGIGGEDWLVGSGGTLGRDKLRALDRGDEYGELKWGIDSASRIVRIERTTFN